MAKEEYYPEETLVEKVQSGEYGWKDYVWYHSREWRTDLPMDDDTALRFLDMKQEEMETALAYGDA